MMDKIIEKTKKLELEDVLKKTVSKQMLKKKTSDANKGIDKLTKMFKDIDVEDEQEYFDTLIKEIKKLKEKDQKSKQTSLFKKSPSNTKPKRLDIFELIEIVSKKN